MKKVVSVVLAASMMMSLVACSSSSSSSTATTAAETTAVAAETTAAESASEETTASEAAETNEVKVGFIFLHDENSTYDRNFMEAAVAACEAQGVEYMQKTGIPESNECYEAAADLIDHGCNVIFADSFGHESYLLQAAKEYPDVQFCHATGTMAHTENLDNFHDAFAAIYDGRYLAGVAAGMKLNEMIENGEFTAEEAKVGYVGAFTYAEVISGYTSWFLGVRSVCPTATMEVSFTGSWYDEAAEKEKAQMLIADGCKLISQHADSMGAPTACEEAGVPNVSYNGSTISACPNTFIVSSRINWQPYMEHMIECVKNGEAIEHDWTGTLATGSVVLTDVNEAVAAEGTADKLEEVKAQLEDGSLHVFDTATFTVNGETLTSYMADVDTDEAYTADTEAISDGYFHESEYRSAPYFDVQIDGITLLDTAF